ncbi:amino acid permease [Virgibacillus pantothenticus]|uniref:Amino acid permease n=1 Tax=Virgibacillus pantothenticus TaxID=1473 RepID=A0A0L0QK86_VIRPA|nr:amino acid permease [Virgibacillus pantothenticus]KNE18981.1 amino acid permease [Virgibacillus pantothenticus]MBU8565281.1 amino acid permease [Virgibacillus pantothenticus]MBU8599500.1 amino acid permease [Virgibacillus pantothenticus]MBU8633600.1 amino acid permease [Virgibacillus pantothenticus]MBU8641780.1 amino acid permease [Virgibacillus pantothenticus]
MTENRKKISATSFLLMAFTAVFAFNNIINATASIGLSAVLTFLFATIFYFIPFALMIGEFSSANAESESGVYSWIRTSLGEKWAFLGSWSYFFVNLFYFTALLPQILIYASYTFTGKNIFGSGATIAISILSIFLFWLATFVSIKGVSWISKVTDVSGVARILMGVGFIVFALAVVFILGEPSAQEFTSESVMPSMNWNYFATLAWILQAVGGAEAIGVYVKDIKGGNKTFIRTIIIAAFSIGIMYALGSVAVGLIMPAEALQDNYSDALFEAFAILGSYFGIGDGITRFVGLIMLLSAVGSLVIWTAAPVKILFSEIPEGIFGKWVAKTNHEGNPTNALTLQAVVVTILLIIPALGIGSVNSLLKTLINMTAATSLIPVLFLLIAYIMFRVKKDDLPRTFKVGKRSTGIVMGIMLLVFFLFAFFVSTFPSPAALMDYFATGVVAEGSMNPLFSLTYNVVGIVIFIGFAFICYKRYERKEKIKGEENGHN